MQIEFMPIDFDYVDINNKDVIRVFGRTKQGKRACIIDDAVNFFYVLGEIDNLFEKLNQIPEIEKAEIVDKNFLEKPVKAIKVFCRYNKIQEVADKIKAIAKGKIETRERDINQITRYIIEKKLKPLVWHEIEGDETKIEGLNVDLVIKAKKIKESEQHEFKPKVLAFDIETEKFEIGRGEIFMISMVSDDFEKVLTWKKCEKKQAYVECFKDEEEMIKAFAKYVKKINPDILTGYFSDGFDLPYIRARAEYNDIDIKLGKDNSRIVFSKGRPLNARIKGIVHVDLLKFIETAYAQYLQSETLSLNEVASELLGEGKLEVDHSIKKEHRKEEEWMQYFEYNLHDSKLTYNLFQKIWPDMLELTKVVQEPLFQTSRHALSGLVENYILHNLEKFNEIAERRPLHDEIQQRKMQPRPEGAFVLQPKAGLYDDLCIFDFTSMHTSIIVSFNISKTTLLEKKEKDCYESPELELGKEKCKFYFSKKQGFFSKLANEIIELRKKYKKQYKENPNPITKARSNAFKVLSASIHGYIGFFGARYYSIESSASILAFVRQFNKETIDKTNKAGFNVVYADSVDGKTKVFLKKNGKIFEEEISKIFEKIDKKNFGKEYNFKKNIEVLTLDKNGNSVFKPVKYVMRHRCNKKMFRIYFTNNWSIDVTEDHSLMGYQSVHFNQSNEKKKDVLKRIIEIKPQEIGKKANSIITLKKVPNMISSKNYPKELYEFIGYFIGDGSFSRNKFHQENNKDYYLRLSTGSDKKEIFEKLIKPLIKQDYIRNYWFNKTREGDITINGLKLVELIAQNCRDNNGKKVIPEWLFDEKEENITAFLRGLFSADGCVMMRNGAPIVKFTSINDDCINKVRRLLYNVGISHSVFKENNMNKYKSKEKIYSSGSYSRSIILKNKDTFSEKIGFLLERKNKLAQIKTKSIQKKLIREFDFELQGVKNIKKIKTPKYVYDIEVKDNHRFFANYVLVHNTDSVAFTMNNRKKQEALDFLKRLNDELPGVMELELEDFYKRGIWVTKKTGEFGAKKKYALISENGKMKIRGFETVRRDWCDLAKEVQNKILKMILVEGNADNALIYAKKIIKELKNKEVPIEKLVIKTQLKKPIDEYDNIGPHVVIAKEMIKRGMPVDAGTLIKYVVASGKEKLIRDKAKLPDDVKAGEYDIDYYTKSQMISAIGSIFDVFGINADELAEGKKQMKLGEF